jgi:redox-sensitive bicupin YhaK (pirin superfamily)
VHAEMFPLLKEDADNRMEMFQIWLNLPAASKMAPPHFKMFWAEDIPDTVAKDENGRATHVSVVAGKLKAGDQAIDPLAPPPDSWAAREHADLAIWTLRMEPGAKWTLPAATKGTNRVLYFFKGKSVTVAGQAVTGSGAIQLQADAAVELVNGETISEFLVLQGKPIGEPVVQYGPFVMNSQAEIMQTMQEYQRTQFGGWPWGDHAPTHGRDPARFARHPDGKEDRPQAETAAA